jgi:hypothetical protein
MTLSGAAVPEAVVHGLQGFCRFAEFSGLRPSNRSASGTGPCGASKTYGFSTFTHGSAQRSAPP